MLKLRVPAGVIIMSNKQKIDSICVEYADCQLCPFGAKVYVDKEPFRVFYRGNPEATVVLVGEGPGRDEIAAGRPFVGAAGQQLDKILQYAGIPQDDVFILNSFVCSDDGKKKPTDEVLEACNQRMKKMVEVVRPKLLIALGMYAWRAVNGLQSKPPLKQYLDKAYAFKMHCGEKMYVVAEYHPSYYLRNPAAKKEAAVRWDAISKVYRVLTKTK